MQLTVGPQEAVFAADDGRLAGRYTFVNPYKPSLHPLNSPAGHTVTLSMPHDHPHHRGLMFGLSACDINFWEERQVRPGERVGRQRHLSFIDRVERGDTVGFTEDVMWEALDGSLPTFRETRSLSCRISEDEPGFAWTWRTELEALRDVELILSHWAHRRPDGHPVNYHGLGIRFRRDFGCVSRGTTLFVDGTETAFAEALGAVPEEVTFVGTIDGSTPPPRAGVTIRQRQPYPLFAIMEPFPLVCLGPTNAASMTTHVGDRLTCDYALRAFDLVD